MMMRWYIGVAQGASGEGIDVALVETSHLGLHLRPRLLFHQRKTLAPELRQRYLQAIMPTRPVELSDWMVLHRALGEEIASAIISLAQHARVDLQRVLGIGYLGPLLWHEPMARLPSSLECGLTATIAERTGLTVFSDFRSRDLAAGGYGMPLNGLTDWLWFRSSHQPRLIIHLGGVASLTWLPESCRPQEVLSFETGPCGRMVDLVVRTRALGNEAFDIGGRHAVQGRCLDALVNEWLQDPFFQKRPPKSLARASFGQAFLTDAAKQTAERGGSFEDLLCSLTHFISQSITLAAKLWIPKFSAATEIVLGGGGARNGFLWRLMEQHFPDHRLVPLEVHGVPVTAHMATCAATLAALLMDGVAASSLNTTGAVDRLLGQVVPGSAVHWARCVRWMDAAMSHSLSSPYKAA